MLEKKLKIVHLQLTSRCNLKCSFCGQWGSNGFMKRTPQADISIDEWKKVVDSIYLHCHDSLPQICLWGGEPLIYKEFDNLVEYIRNKGFEIALVTNGVLLSSHRDAIDRYVSTVYVSLDGTGDIHERSRGVKGIYQKTIEGVSSLKNPDISKICMCTINEFNYHYIVDFPFAAADIGFDRILFQNIMFSTSKDIAAYKEWLKKEFGILATHVDSWLIDEFNHYIYKLPEVIKKLLNNLEKYPIKTVLYPFELDEKNILEWFISRDGLSNQKRDCDYCLAPFWHLQVTASGNVHYCVDFDDFSAGNIKNDDVMDIFENEISEKFRQEIFKGKNPMCKRCPWRFNTRYTIDDKRKDVR